MNFCSVYHPRSQGVKVRSYKDSNLENDYLQIREGTNSEKVTEKGCRNLRKKLGVITTQK